MAKCRRCQLFIRSSAAIQCSAQKTQAWKTRTSMCVTMLATRNAVSWEMATDEDKERCDKIWKTTQDFHDNCINSVYIDMKSIISPQDDTKKKVCKTDRTAPPILQRLLDPAGQVWAWIPGVWIPTRWPVALCQQLELQKRCLGAQICSDELRKWSKHVKTVPHDVSKLCCRINGTNQERNIITINYIIP